MTMDRFALFHTPVVVHHLDGMEEVNRELTERLVDEARNQSGFLRSNVGGWHSRPDLCQRPEPCYHGLMDRIVRHVRMTFDEVAEAAGAATDMRFRFAMHGWAMVMQDGHYTILHDHAEAHWSTVYYVDAGDADLELHPTSGLLAFIDPRRAATSIPGVELFPSTFTIVPRTSALVVFPGFLQHYVHPYRGTAPRISISCNLQMQPMLDPGAAR